MGDRPVVLCVDESERSRRAVAAGLAVMSDEFPLILVTVREGTDPALVTGSGHAGGAITPDEFRALEADDMTRAGDLLAEVADELDLDRVDPQVDPQVELRVLDGSPGPAICQFAEEQSAAAVVIGSRGRSGFRRAVLGSVSDHVVRHASCPVIVTTVDEHDRGP